jgi:repressor LexA
MTDKKTPQRSREIKGKRYQMSFTPSLWESLENLADSEPTDVAKIIDRACEKEVSRLPVLGNIPCGPLAEVQEQEIQEYANVGDLLKIRKGDFLLRAYGDSMTGDGIENGDLVLIRPQESCDNGQIAAVMVETPFGWQSTLKHVMFGTNSKKITLKPMNPAHEPIVIDVSKEELKVLGVFKGLVRQR